MSCAKCRRLRDEEKAATAARDFSRATDCRVLIARHPEHGTTPVAKVVADERQGA